MLFEVTVALSRKPLCHFRNQFLTAGFLYLFARGAEGMEPQD